MKKWTRNLVLIGLAMTLAGCAKTNATPAPESLVRESYTSPVLVTDYENALTTRNQLALGTLGLQDAGLDLSLEQATTLLPLWQALRGTVQNGAAATAEVDALLAQIEDSLDTEQLEAISDMQLTQDDLRSWAESQGITLGTGAGVGMGGGQGRSMSEEERLTRQMEEGRTGAGGNGGLSTAVLDAVIEYLEKRAASD